VEPSADPSAHRPARSLGPKVRAIEAGLVALVAATMAVCLPMRFHDYRTTDPQQVAAAAYVGPDYHVGDDERARMLAPTVRHSHTGLEHHPSGAEIGLALLALCALGIVAARTARHRRAPWTALGLALASGAAFVWISLDALLAHLFDAVEPTLAEHAFHGATVVLGALSVVLALHALYDLGRALAQRARRASP
jgi:hypothetical protein